MCLEPLTVLIASQKNHGGTLPGPLKPAPFSETSGTTRHGSLNCVQQGVPSNQPKINAWPLTAAKIPLS